MLGAYGGMGSFNDFVAGQTTIDGKFAWKPGYAELNEEIDALRSKAWSLAAAIKRNHEIESASHIAVLTTTSGQNRTIAT